MHPSLRAYVPRDRYLATLRGVGLPERSYGSALFADISGFSALTAALVEVLGPRRGAEALPSHLNLVYDACIDEVQRHGGSVIGFSGDAITCWFPGETAWLACCCAQAMQQRMRDFAGLELPGGAKVSVSMKVAIAYGAVRRLLVGDPKVQLLDGIAGQTVARMAALEQQAQAGDIVLDEASVATLPEPLRLAGWRYDAGRDMRIALLEQIASRALPPAEELQGTLSAQALRPWLLPEVFARLQRGQGEFLTELRPAVALFLRFAELDYDHDPEAANKLQAYICWVQAVVQRYGGALIQLTFGDKGNYLYVAFGAPVAHEDDVKRAAAAALELRQPPEALAFIAPVHIGMSKGTMRTGAYGGSRRRSYGVLGEEVNLAARLMGQALDGQILVSGRVQHILRDSYALQALPPMLLKGHKTPLPVFSLLAPHSPNTMPVHEPAHSLPLIGRQQELADITVALEQSLNGQGRIVAVRAEAGMGKSRLVAEALRVASAKGLRSFGGEAQSYAARSAYMPWQSIWRGLFGLANQDSAAEQRQQLQQRLETINPALLSRLPLLSGVLAVPIADNALTASLDPQLRKQSTEALLVDCLRALAQEAGEAQQALLIVIEDMHWLDPLSQDLLEACCRVSMDLPLMFLLAYRPLEFSYSQHSQLALAALPHFQTIDLQELSDEAMVQLLHSKFRALCQHHRAELTKQSAASSASASAVSPTASLTASPKVSQAPLATDPADSLADTWADNLADNLTADNSANDATVAHSIADSPALAMCAEQDAGQDAEAITLPEAVLQQLMHKAQGNPFYAEELLNYLYDYVLQQPSRTKQLWQILPQLELPDSLHSLILSRIDSLQDQAQLTLKVASVLGRVLRVDWLQGYYPDLGDYRQVTEQLETLRRVDLTPLEHPEPELAYVFKHAMTREVAYESLSYATRAQLHAQFGMYLEHMAAQQPEENLLDLLAYHYERSEDVDKKRYYLERAAQQAYANYANEAAIRYYQSLLPLLEPSERSRCLLPWGDVLALVGRWEEAQQCYTQARQEAHNQEDAPQVARCQQAIGRLLHFQALYSQAQQCFEAACAMWRSPALAEHPEHLLGLSANLAELGNVAYAQGDYSQARQHLQASLELARRCAQQAHAKEQRASQRNLATILSHVGNVERDTGQHLAAHALYRESLELRQTLSDKRGIAESFNSLGLLASEQGDYTTAEDYLQQGLQLARDIGDKRSVARSLSNLGNVASDQEQLEPAESLYRESVSIARELGDKQSMLTALVNLGMVLRFQGKLEAAQQIFSESQDLRRDIGNNRVALNIS